jgi:hypothetical protein
MGSRRPAVAPAYAPSAGDEEPTGRVSGGGFPNNPGAVGADCPTIPVDACGESPGYIWEIWPDPGRSFQQCRWFAEPRNHPLLRLSLLSGTLSTNGHPAPTHGLSSPGPGTAAPGSPAAAGRPTAQAPARWPSSLLLRRRHGSLRRRRASPLHPSAARGAPGRRRHPRPHPAHGRLGRGGVKPTCWPPGQGPATPPGEDASGRPGWLGSGNSRYGH